MRLALFCAACRVMRPAAEFLAFWPLADPARIRYVCRPSVSGRDDPHCFREMVGPAADVGIALAEDLAEAAA